MTLVFKDLSLDTISRTLISLPSMLSAFKLPYDEAAMRKSSHPQPQGLGTREQGGTSYPVLDHEIPVP